MEGGLSGDARRAAERLAEAQLVDRLAATGFGGPLWRVFEADLAEYGIAVFMRWTSTGEVYARAAAMRRVVSRPRRMLSYEERLGMVDLIVAYGLRYYREGLRAGRWRSDGGASLKTFFIGACLLQFKAAFDAWRPDTVGEEIAHEFPDTVEPWVSPSARQPADVVVIRERTWDIVAACEDPLTQKILVSVAAGMSYPQIAKMLGNGLTAEAAGARVLRLRYKLEAEGVWA